MCNITKYVQYNIETFLLIVYSLLRNFIYQYIIYINNNNIIIINYYIYKYVLKHFFTINKIFLSIKLYIFLNDETTNNKILRKVEDGESSDKFVEFLVIRYQSHVCFNICTILVKKCKLQFNVFLKNR